MTAPAPLVSVVVPAFNAERTISATLASVLAQTVQELEVVVVDDGSSDRTAQVARRTPDARVKVISQPKAGAAAARNTGLAASIAHYVAFLDADDLWLRFKLERQLAFLSTRPEVKALQSGVFYVDDNLNVLSVRRCSPWGDRLLDTLMFKNLPAFPSTVVFVREALESIGGFDPSLVILEDWSLAVEAARTCALESIEEPLALYRVHGGNRSQDLGIHIDPGFRVLKRVFGDPTLPEHVRAHEQEVYARFFMMLAGGAFRNGQWDQWVRWTARAVRRDPRTISYMLKFPARRLRRARSRHEDVPDLRALAGLAAVGSPESLPTAPSAS